MGASMHRPGRGGFRRLAAWVQRACCRAPREAEYVPLKSAETTVDLDDLEEFVRSTFSDVSITRNDLLAFRRDSEVADRLLRLMPFYKHCAAKCDCLERFLAAPCKSHMRPPAEVELQKCKRVLQTLDVIMLKLVIGEFSFADADSLEGLLEKFSTDQSTLCEVEKLERLIMLDEEESKLLMSTDATERRYEEDLSTRLSSLPLIPKDVAGETVSTPAKRRERVVETDAAPS